MKVRITIYYFSFSLFFKILQKKITRPLTPVSYYKTLSVLAIYCQMQNLSAYAPLQKRQLCHIFISENYHQYIIRVLKIN